MRHAVEGPDGTWRYSKSVNENKKITRDIVRSPRPSLLWITKNKVVAAFKTRSLHLRCLEMTAATVLTVSLDVMLLSQLSLITTRVGAYKCTSR